MLCSGKGRLSLSRFLIGTAAVKSRPRGAISGSDNDRETNGTKEETPKLLKSWHEKTGSTLCFEKHGWLKVCLLNG